MLTDSGLASPPPTDLLALYYCACDCVLIFQYWYYSKYYHRGVKISTISASLEANERTPLIGDGSVIEDDLSAKDDSDDDSSVRTRSSCTPSLRSWSLPRAWPHGGVAEHSYGSDDDLPPAAPEPWAGVGRTGGRMALGDPVPLVARPQILKNRTTKCEGLSLALFVFAVAGNLTYVASISVKSTKHDYLVESFSWLVGSLGTVFLDFIVLVSSSTTAGPGARSTGSEGPASPTTSASARASTPLPRPESSIQPNSLTMSP